MLHLYHLHVTPVTPKCQVIFGGKMKLVFKIVGIIALVIVVIIVAIVTFIGIVFKNMTTATMVPTDYTSTISTGGEIEATYLALGSYEVESIEVDVEYEWKKIAVYYPAEIKDSYKKYPVVVFVNGTGIFAYRYSALFEHLSSWGFIVIGNNDPSTWSGVSTDITLEYILSENENPNSIFYNKIDTENIGISGHSQGGVGVFNSVTSEKYADIYKCAVSLSPTEEEMAAVLKIPYDSSKVDISIMLLAGTENDVISIEKMTEMYDKINSPKVMAIKSKQGHGEMLYSADGYVTAWFMWQLQDNENAGKAFIGEDAEIIKNNLYQNQKIEN